MRLIEGDGCMLEKLTKLVPITLAQVFLALFSLPLSAYVQCAYAQEIRVLSAGAVEPGLSRVVTEFTKDTKINVNVEYATAPTIRSRLADGMLADLLISPLPTLEEYANLGVIQKNENTKIVVLGRVGVGLVTQYNAPSLQINNLEQFKQALQAADVIVYNRASTGLYIDKLLAHLGLLQTLKEKTVRFSTGEEVIRYMSTASPKSLGLAAVTEIKHLEPLSVKYAGPLPPEIQNYTTYGAALMSRATNVGEARELLKNFTSPVTQNLLRSAGIEYSYTNDSE